MKLIESFGKRHGYQKESHVSFVIKTKYRRRAGAILEIFVEASVDHNKGIRAVSLRENGTNDMLKLEHIDKEKLYELIIKEL